jgi:hypothetical protein
MGIGGVLLNVLLRVCMRRIAGVTIPPFSSMSTSSSRATYLLSAFLYFYDCKLEVHERYANVGLVDAVKEDCGAQIVDNPFPSYGAYFGRSGSSTEGEPY